MSLDGCIAGPNDSPEQSLGEGGERLHEWMHSGEVTFRDELDSRCEDFFLVTDGVESAIAQARAAEGDKDIGIGWASVAQQCLNAGLVDEISIPGVAEW